MPINGDVSPEVADPVHFSAASLPRVGGAAGQCGTRRSGGIQAADSGRWKSQPVRQHPVRTSGSILRRQRRARVVFPRCRANGTLTVRTVPCRPTRRCSTANLYLRRGRTPCSPMPPRPIGHWMRDEATDRRIVRGAFAGDAAAVGDSGTTRTASRISTTRPPDFRRCGSPWCANTGNGRKVAVCVPGGDQPYRGHGCNGKCRVDRDLDRTHHAASHRLYTPLAPGDLVMWDNRAVPAHGESVRSHAVSAG